MTYNICETCLLIPVNLSKAECAAWVQAFGSIFTIAASIGVAIYAANKQQKITTRSFLMQQRQLNLGVAKTLGELAKKSLELQKYMTKTLCSEEAVVEARKNQMPGHFQMITYLEGALNGIGLDKLPSNLVSPCMILATSVQQLKIKINSVLLSSKSLTKDECNDLVRTLIEMEKSLAKTVNDFEVELRSAEAL